MSQPFWFYGCEAYYNKASANQPAKSEPTEPAPGMEQAPAKSADEQVNEMLVQSPDMSAPTLVNTLKARGLKVVDEKIEADSATTQAPVLTQKESETIQAEVTFRAQFLESRTYQDGVGPTRFKVALIQEGLGNLRDGFYYTRGALEKAIATFEGKKCFADHPSRSEEADRPERSVRDIIGHFESVHVEESELGEAQLVADLVMPPDPPFEWARALVRQAAAYSAKYPEQTFVGLSINASGDAVAQPIDEFLGAYKLPEGAKPKVLKAREEGMTQVRVVEKITDAVSCDLVTEPGAKGRVLEIIESNRGTMKKTIKAKETDAAKEMPKEDEAKQADAKPEAKGEEMKPEGEEKKEAGEEHDDAEQDKKLILDMIKKHMSDDAADMEGEQESAAMEACEAYKAMGYSEDEAMKNAAAAMRLAKHMAAKREAGEPAKAEAVEAVETVESEKLIKAEAKIAMLERELAKRTLEETLDKKLRESGLGRAETDKIRALIGTPKSVEHVEHTIKVFKEAFGAVRSEPKSLKGVFVLGSEKESAPAKAEGKFSFSDCVTE